MRVRVVAGVLLLAAVCAMGALEVALVTDDFSVAYVAENHARSTPLLFSIATAWAALEGSIVLWCLVLAAFTFLFVRRLDESDRLGMAATAVIGVVALFFFGLVLTVANPFGTLANPPADGPGPNPLLLDHLLMAVHPPLLYLGYVGFTIPFGLGVGALMVGDPGPGWLHRTRRWSLVAWTFLTAGIAVGALWSYEVLGWGGYWAWDPVENASLLPWLVGTAFVHSSLAQVRRGALSAWNLLLVIATFSLTILGTFLTRSGVVASVHSFTQSAVGPVLLGFFVFVVIGALGVFATRVHLIASPPRIERIMSREGAFLVNNLLLSVLTVVVLLGTTYPLILEAATGAQVSVGRPFFDRFAGPIGLALLVVMAVGSVLPYRAVRPGVVWDRLQWPCVTALTVGVVVVIAGPRNPWVVLTVVLATLVPAITVAEARRQTAARSGRRSQALWGLAMRNRSYWGGQISHIGFALFVLGVVLSANLGTQTAVTLPRGEPVAALGTTFRFDGIVEHDEANRTVRVAEIALLDGRRTVAEMRPRIATYPARGQSVAGPAVRMTLRDDLYLALRGMTSDEVALDVYRHPFMWVLWLGGGITVLGGVWALQGRAARRRGSPIRQHPATVMQDA
ncbi:heme lyase CcmF/NrfE family subunit [Euzebya sp.]|uniref:heme lyase CcmF/NrfE family subunit n=1 Tax=Euzebya sp. TaxID=1971409 RepID=UPI003517586A